MTTDQIHAIFTQIVKDMAYQAGLQINTVAIVGEPPDIRGEAFGMDYQDYLDGTFWSRTWVYQGADPESIKGEYPVLFVEQRTATSPVDNLEELNFSFDLLLIEKIECPHCPPDDDRTGEAVKRNVLTMLRRFLIELYTYQFWEVDRSGNITFEWISEGRRQVYQVDAGIDLVTLHDDLVTKLEAQSVTFTEWGNFPDLRGWFLTLDFTICEDASGAFNYINPVVTTLATTQCDTC